jgi:adenylosuccinate lyase
VEEEPILDVLADRYATSAMKAVWSPRGRILLEREFWIAVMKAQHAQGLDISVEAIEAYERVKEQIDLSAIRARERVSRHDVKARIDEFCALAGHEQIHKGLTSRDLTENVEQAQILRSLRVIRLKHAACLDRLAKRAAEFRDVILTARTHNVPAQATTVGRRFAMFGTEMLLAHECLEALVARYPLRGLKGPVGTQLDLLSLFNGDAQKVVAVEQEVARLLGFRCVLETVGQVYPRSLDYEVLSCIVQLAAGPSSLCKTLRLMAGQELASEGFRSGQVGSSSMPHKINSRSCERINGLAVVIKGFLEMVAGISGDQWSEGDVSCSVVRRIALPGAMFATDGLLETLWTVLAEMEIFPGAVQAEFAKNRPFLTTTTVLMNAVKRGAGREKAHAAIQEHALAVARDLRDGKITENDLLDRLAADGRIGLSKAEMETALGGDRGLLGAALEQVDRFLERAGEAVDQVPGAPDYVAGEIL